MAARTKRPQRADITEQMILGWADRYHKSTGEWPTRDSGPIEDNAPETWRIVEDALYKGKRGLPRGGSLYKLFRTHRGIPPANRLPPPKPPLTVETILGWADQHYASTGMWPSRHSGAVKGVVGETWAGVNRALSKGLRSLQGGRSLSALLASERDEFSPKSRPSLTVDLILELADEYFAVNGRWPNATSGKVLNRGNAPGSWSAINSALQTGLRGLPGNTSLSRLISEHRGFSGTRAIVRPTLPRHFTVEQILEYADRVLCIHRKVAG